MPLTIPEVGVSSSVECGGLTIFPLFHERPSLADYTLAHDAMAWGIVSVREATEDGVVASLQVDNRGDQPVLFIEGEQFRGGKQDRVVARSVLVAARSPAIIPVICIEWDRWIYKSREFATGSSCPPSLRSLLKESRRSVITGRPEHERNHSGICRENHRNGDLARTWGRLTNLSRVSEMNRGRVDDMRMRVAPIDGAAGVAVCAGAKIVSIDVFDRADTMAAMWDCIMRGIALDALEIPEPEQGESILNVMLKVCELADLAWRQMEAVGLGEEYIAEDRNGDLATALVVNGVAVHISISAPVE